MPEREHWTEQADRTPPETTEQRFLLHLCLAAQDGVHGNMVGVLFDVPRGHKSASGSMYNSWYNPIHTDVHEERIDLYLYRTAVHGW